MTPPQRDLAAELGSWTNEYPEAWKPEPGDSLVGELERYSQGQGRYGPAWIAQVREERTGALCAVWLFWAALVEAFKAERPKPGERIGIRRLDDGEGAHGSYRRFALVVEREGGASLPDFDALGPAPDTPPTEPEPHRQGDGLDLAAPNPFD